MSRPTRRWLLLIALGSGCHSRPPASHSHAILWAHPDSAPQLQSYLHAWPAQTPLPTQCRDSIATIDGDSVGPLRIRQSLPSVLAQCPHPLVGWNWGDEGIPEPAFMVRFGTAVVLVTLTDTTDAATVYYLATTDPLIRTSDGVHVGMSVDSLNARLGPLEFLEGECGLYAASKRRPHLGIQLTLPADSVDCGSLVPKPPSLPRGSRVATIFLHRAA